MSFGLPGCPRGSFYTYFDDIEDLRPSVWASSDPDGLRSCGPISEKCPTRSADAAVATTVHERSAFTSGTVGARVDRSQIEGPRRQTALAVTDWGADGGGMLPVASSGDVDVEAEILIAIVEVFARSPDRRLRSMPA